MPDYCRYCSIAISKAAGEKRSYNSSKTQKLLLHDFSSPQLKQEEIVEARDLVPKLRWSSSLAGTSGIVLRQCSKIVNVMAAIKQLPLSILRKLTTLELIFFFFESFQKIIQG